MTMAVMPSPSSHTALAALSRLPASAAGAPMAVAALAVELSASSAGHVPTDVRLIPAGTFRSWDGRPDALPAWVMSEADGQRIVSQMADRQSACVIDYEHATMHAKESGAKAPAAGWYSKLEWRPDGLWAIGIDWTAQAAQHIAANEYRYVSPVFTFDEQTGHVERLLFAALTNDPGLDGLTDLAALAANLLLSPPKENPVNELLKKLLAALGLQESATEPEALAAIAALKNNVVALSAQVAAPDPARYVPIATLSALQTERAALQGQLAALTGEVNGGKIDKMISDGLAAGKLTPATESWARALGGSDIAALSAFLVAAPVVVKPGETQTGGAGGAGNAAALSALEIKVCKNMGLSQEEFLKTRLAAA